MFSAKKNIDDMLVELIWQTKSVYLYILYFQKYDLLNCLVFQSADYVKVILESRSAHNHYILNLYIFIKCIFIFIFIKKSSFSRIKHNLFKLYVLV